MLLESRDTPGGVLLLGASRDAATCEALLEVSSGVLAELPLPPLLGASKDGPDEELLSEVEDETLASEQALVAGTPGAVSEQGLEDDGGSSASVTPEDPNKGTSTSAALRAAGAELSKALFLGEPLCCLESADWVT